MVRGYDGRVQPVQIGESLVGDGAEAVHVRTGHVRMPRARTGHVRTPRARTPRARTGLGGLGRPSARRPPADPFRTPA